MSADYGTEHYRGYCHPAAADQPVYIAVFSKDGSDHIANYSREQITELVELAEKAWPGLTVSLALAAFGNASDELLGRVHYHSATGQENTPCLCAEPGTYARQAPNPLAPDA